MFSMESTINSMTLSKAGEHHKQWEDITPKALLNLSRYYFVHKRIEHGVRWVLPVCLFPTLLEVVRTLATEVRSHQSWVRSEIIRLTELDSGDQFSWNVAIRIDVFGSCSFHCQRQIRCLVNCVSWFSSPMSREHKPKRLFLPLPTDIVTTKHT